MILLIAFCKVCTIYHRKYRKSQSFSLINVFHFQILECDVFKNLNSNLYVMSKAHFMPPTNTQDIILDLFLQSLNVFSLVLLLFCLSIHFLQISGIF